MFKLIYDAQSLHRHYSIHNMVVIDSKKKLDSEKIQVTILMTESLNH